MDNIKTQFSIKDLENLSGVKAHTIRIWEKRYNLLQPIRSKTNIRSYSLENLQKLLNISCLNDNGIKISKIAALSNTEISDKVKDLLVIKPNNQQAILNFKMAMLKFDQNLFLSTYSRLEQSCDFKTIFYEVYIPLLTELGVLWQTNSITPAHEHFLTVQFRQKILINIERLQNINLHAKGKPYVLYLPENEVHDLALLYINYELLSKGKQVIYLGESIPLDNLTKLTEIYEETYFVSCFTVKPNKTDVINYLNKMYELLLQNTKNKALLLGPRLAEVKHNKLQQQIKIYSSVELLVKDL
jgi:DNA-binding transcriptional MerR regulator